jgi:hypothetical protein
MAFLSATGRNNVILIYFKECWFQMDHVEHLKNALLQYIPTLFIDIELDEAINNPLVRI